MSLRDAYADLVLGSCCLGCGAPGRMLCLRCRASLPDSARDVRPSPYPPGLARSTAVAPYEGLVKEMVIGLKERQLLALARPLGDLLALAVARHLPVVPSATIVLVPVPSRAASVRARGFDSTCALACRAAVGLRSDEATGAAEVSVVSLLRTRPGLQDQAGLDAQRRAANLTGALTCPAPALRGLARRHREVLVVLCDDVITTGATAREAQRALAAVGLPIAGVAAVAATERRHNPDSRRVGLSFTDEAH